ncbi:MAG: penicillin-binding protein, partial [Leptolyngbya sp.]|nr:penicillin-binding protein [Candidatus Melainabacteria bacterium]
MIMFPPIVRKIGSAIRLISLVGGTALLLATIIFGALVVWDLRDVPDLAYLEHYHHGSPIEIYDRTDKLITVVNPGVQNRIIPLKQVSNQITQAVIAVEDRQFFQHSGVSFLGVSRAMLANIKAGRMVEGGSTITQQLVKNLFHEGEKRTLIRKLSETALAFMIEARYSKWQILQTYLNEIYFGNGAWGVEQAANTYFNKHASAITLPEAAFIAGLIRSPSYLGNQKNRVEAMQRQRQVLGIMAENGYITSQQHDYYAAMPLRFARKGTVQGTVPFEKFPYFVSYVLELVKSLMPDEGDNTRIGRGVRVYTTLDQDAQKIAESSIKKGIVRAPHGIDEGAIVACSVSDGSVRALVGGAGDYWKNQWNCATNPHTAGSSFKPFVYLAAFTGGALDAESFLDDTRLEVPQIGGRPYVPKNYDGRFLGKITVRQALTQSRNVCAVKVARQIGMQPIIVTAQEAGIRSPLDANLSLALGSAAVTPLEMAGAYGTLARGGVAVTPWIVRKITSLDGVPKHSYEPNLHRVFDPACVLELNSILEDVVKKGTGVAAKLKDRTVAGKTGTSDNSTDLWFVGFTSDMVTAVWAGNRDHSQAIGKKVTGGTVAAVIFRDFNQGYYKVHKTPNLELLAKTGGVKLKPEEERLKDEQAAAKRIIPATGPRRPIPSPEVDPPDTSELTIQTPVEDTRTETTTPPDTSAPPNAPAVPPLQNIPPASAPVYTPPPSVTPSSPTPTPAPTPTPTPAPIPENTERAPIPSVQETDGKGGLKAQTG